MLAVPMLYLMLGSATWAWYAQDYISESNRNSENGRKESQEDHRTRKECLRSFAVPQLLLTVLAITNFHVQIITRISSGYPLVYIWVADSLTRRLHLAFFGSKTPSWIVVRWMVVYALVQAALFASFLPPA